jgi:protein-tyrosine phosphatase
MAEAMLRARLAQRGVVATVRSAGTRAVGGPADPHAVEVLAERGLDLGAHQSLPLRGELVASADLVLAMAREHLREAVVASPGSLPRSFTLKELVRRGEAVGARGRDEDLAAWLQRAGAGRSTAALMGRDPRDDVADPIGRPRADFARTRDELEGLLDRLVPLAWPAGATA